MSDIFGNPDNNTESNDRGINTPVGTTNAFSVSNFPGYLVGADNHNIGNAGNSWFDPSTWGDGISSAGKFAAVSVLSGASSLYDSAVTVTNWFGADVKLNDNQDWISSLDQDLGQYYGEHRQAADLAGFVATSLVPGMGGIKVLQAGQAALRGAKFSGAIGANMSRATGILAPSIENYVKLAGTEIKNAQVTFSNINVNTLKALGSGLSQNILEGAAFESMVQFTMQASPILKDQDNWDIAKNIAMGGVVNGVIGGVLTGAKSWNQIGKARVAEDFRLKTSSSRELLAPGTSDADSIILGAENRAMTPDVVQNIDPLNQLTDAQIANSAAAKAKKSIQIDNDARKSIHSMSTGSTVELNNVIADSVTGMDQNTALKNFLGATEITRPLNVTKAESVAALEGDGTGLSSRYITISGENAGQTSYEVPKVLSLADRVAITAGQSTQDAVAAEVKTFKFGVEKLWNPVPKAQAVNAWKEAEARFIWAAEAPDKAFPIGMTVSQNDLPVLQRMLADGRTDFNVTNQAGTKWSFPTEGDLKLHILERKDTIANDMMMRRLNNPNPTAGAHETGTLAIAKITDQTDKYLNGIRDSVDPLKGRFATADATAADHARLVNSGLKSANDAATPSYFKPTTAKINYKTESDIGANGNILDGLVAIKQQQLINAEAATNVATKQAGSDIMNRVGDISLDQLNRANSKGAGAGFISFAQAAYGSIESLVQQIGGVAKDLQTKLRIGVDNHLESALYHVKANPEAAIEVSTVNQLLTKTSENYVFDAENILGMGTETLVQSRIVKAAKAQRAAAEAGIDYVPLAGTAQEGAPQYIKFQNWEAAALFKAHTEMNGQRVMNRSERFAARGKLDDRDADLVRGIAPNARDFPFVAMVKDDGVNGAGHSTMLFANSEKELADLVAKTNQQFPNLRVLLKSDTAEYHQARQSYDYGMGLNENYIDSSLKREGIYSNFYTQTNPQKVVDDFLQYHYRSADIESADIMRLRHEGAFDWLENQAVGHSALETSKFGGGIKTMDGIAQNEKNPYVSYIKTALNLPSTPTSNPWWSMNKFIDDQGSKLVGRVRQTFDSLTSPEQLGQVNDLLQKYKSQTAFNSGAEMALVNHTAPRAEISKFIRGANSIMSRFTLGLDPLNALNNAIGANVLRGTEINAFTKGLSAENAAIVGDKLAAMMKVGIPGVEGEMITSPTKLIASSIKRFFDPELRPALLAEYKSQGFIRSRLEQFAAMSDDLTLQGTESVGELTSRLGAAFTKAKALAGQGLDTAEKYTGNNFAEEFNRFISADVMRQITDVGQSAGAISKTESLTYINNFVNRVEGNTIASQRPGLFQGPIGQAVGLFQSYQFNMLQNMLRYVAEGDKKDMAMLLGIQGTMYGLQGMPGFKLINDHVVGTMSGNPQHRDIYDATRGIAGKTGGDWLLYGAASNLMQTNLYSRGDINPRTLTVVPTNLADVPFVGGMTKVFGSLYETAQKMSQGGNVWETIRQGIEHNGVSRPLAGMAQVARGVVGPEVFATSGKGTILGSNDLMSLASIARIAGGRPLDEAIQNDTMFSINSYEAVDRAKKNKLAETVRTTQLPGQEASPDQINAFSAAYLLNGGRQGSFGKYMMEQYTKSNTTQAQLLSQKLNNPLSYKIQNLMGGDYNTGAGN